MIRSYNYKDDAEFKKKFARDAALEVMRFGAFLTGDVADEFERLLVQMSPVARDANRSKAYAHSPGQMKSSWRRFAVVSSAGRSFAIANVAAHANIINRGRKPNKAGYWVRTDSSFDRRLKKNAWRKNTGRYFIPAGKRMLGSLQAPKGVVRPAWKYLRRKEEELTKLAIEQAEAA